MKIFLFISLFIVILISLNDDIYALSIEGEINIENEVPPLTEHGFTYGDEWVPTKRFGNPVSYDILNGDIKLVDLLLMNN